ncbi:MAG: hypothetical protein ACK41E_01155 [Deinococcales bacterium]
MLTDAARQPSIEIICEMPKFKLGLEQYMISLGYQVQSLGEVVVLVDTRMGTALRYLETHKKTDQS